MGGSSGGGAGTPTSKGPASPDLGSYSTAGGGQSEQDRLAAMSMGSAPAAPATPTPTKAAQPTNYNATSSGGGQPEQQRLAALSNQVSAPPKPLSQTYDYSTPSYLQSYQVQVPGLPAVNQQPMMGGLSQALSSGGFK